MRIRNGFIVEVTTKGCDCIPYSVMDKHYKGEDYWSDLTDGMNKFTVGGSLDNEGVCPHCGKDVIYNEYLVVTDIKNSSC
jgi:hypothetical protein